MAAQVLRQVANLTTFTTGTLVHPKYAPFPLATALHAARVSIAYQTNVRKSGSWNRMPWPTYLAGYLIMSWGGGVLSHIILGQYPPQLYSPEPWIEYLSVHIVLTGFFHFFPWLLNPRIFDTIALPIDSILRLGSITSCVDLVRTHPDPRINQSVFLHLIIGAIASSGGGLTAATLGVQNAEWGFRTPVFLTGGVLATLDVWGGIVAAFVYGLLTASHPSYQQILLTSNISSVKGPLMTPLGARSAATVVLGVLFLWRVIVVDWMGAGSKVVEKAKLKTQ